jgi:hypothetical protein
MNGRVVAQSVIIAGNDATTGENVVILDNIEVAKNYVEKNAEYARIYKDFWLGATDLPVKIGIANSDLVPDGVEADDGKYMLKNAVVYSDFITKKQNWRLVRADE